MWLTRNSCMQQIKKRKKHRDVHATTHKVDRYLRWFVIIYICISYIRVFTFSGVFVELVRLCDPTSHDGSCSMHITIIKGPHC